MTNEERPAFPPGSPESQDATGLTKLEYMATHIASALAGRCEFTAEAIASDSIFIASTILREVANAK